ncbi:DUF397 domain-containing protein [Micromonospora rifamycinica]|uniref:Uncharacterized protein n=1 Tax=Micromonospora rifamycinica TaxID=291594 RepID=A0A109IK74_9ACTN|nr:DUF397 domain-containing protein [Micromonospora rifamycinica]KWV32040.1 DUF397 domain-containing protein [Micromonospora rifamycinica]SCG79624.1 protein of unknown function [Micromonospora rifamycinica]
MNEIQETVPADARWHKSTRSQTSNCVEVAQLRTAAAAVALRDSKDPGGPILLFPRAGWLGFIEGTKNGQFALD